MSLPVGLLASAKNYLDITWEDTATDEKLAGVLSRGIAYLDRIAGDTLDYTKESQARALLFDYARYARANSLQDFAGDFLVELNGLHIDAEVRNHEETADI